MLRLDFQDCINLKQRNSAKLDAPPPKPENHQHRHHVVVKKLKKSDKSAKLPAEENGIIANCIAHWSEGVWHYLIVKQSKSVHVSSRVQANPKPAGPADTTTGYKCLVS